MPRRFGIGSAQFYRPNGRATASGIVFTRTVGSRTMGLRAAAEEVAKTARVQPVIYSGRPPQGYDWRAWELQKRQNAAAFKGNATPVLVATKAFGMGIDKPNIRYIVHHGMPDSLESYYQEAGRAGRDQRPAHCVMVFTEYDADRSDDLLDPSISLAELRRRFDDANRDRSTGDDITSAMYFHLNTFGGPQLEIQEVRSVLGRFNDLNSRRRYQLTYQNKDDRRLKEHAIVRLLRVGVLSDYEVEFGSKRLTMQTEPFDFERCCRKLLDYVQTAQPHRSNEFGEKLDAIVAGEPHRDALELTRLLIEFTYDVIERSRRRSIQESMLLARSAQGDDEIRTRLMDYLQEGLGSERIGWLMEQQNVQLEDWWDLIEAVQTPLDAGELRGLCIRSLESSPDHPGLLLTRAVAETMSSDHNDSVSWQGIKTAVESCVRSRIPESDTRKALNQLFDLAKVRTRAGDLGVPLAMALLDVPQTDPEFAFCAEVTEERLPELADIQDEVRLIRDVYRAGMVLEQLKGVTETIVQRYNAHVVAQLLGG